MNQFGYELHPIVNNFLLSSWWWLFMNQSLNRFTLYWIFPWINSSLISKECESIRANCPTFSLIYFWKILTWINFWIDSSCFHKIFWTKSNSKSIWASWPTFGFKMVRYESICELIHKFKKQFFQSFDLKEFSMKYDFFKQISNILKALIFAMSFINI